MGWGQVHDEAEALEHAISDRLLAAIAAKLGDPARDPHGDPIPSAELEIDEAETVSLDRLPVGARGRLVRILDADADLLAYLDRLGIAPGRRGRGALPRSPTAARSPSPSRGASAASAGWPPRALAVEVSRHDTARRTRLVCRRAERRRKHSFAARALLARGRMRATAGHAGPGLCRRHRLRRSRQLRAPTSRAAPSSASCCSGSCSWPT